MSVMLRSSDSDVYLGDPFSVYAIFAEIRRVCNPSMWPRLFEVLDASEDEEDCSAQWLEEVSMEAGKFLSIHEKKISIHARDFLIGLTLLGETPERYSVEDAYGNLHSDDTGQFIEKGSPETKRHRPVRIGDPVRWSNRHWKGWSESLTEDETAAVNFYKDDSVSINRVLRGTKEFQYPKHREHSDQLTQAIAKGKVPHTLLAYRGAPWEFYAWLEEGQVFRDDGFVSASITHQGAEDFADEQFAESGKSVRITVIVPKGATAAYVSHVNNDDQSDELLIQRGSRFKVLRVEGGRIVMLLLKGD